MTTEPKKSAELPASAAAEHTDPAVALAEQLQAALGSTRSQPRSLSQGKKRTRLLLVDDHPVVRKGIRATLARFENLEIVGEAADGKEALRMAQELNPDIVLMDIDMPQMNGLAATEVLRKELPKIKVLILSMHSNTDYVLRIIQSGARGFVLKEADTEELCKAIETVQAGEAFFSAEAARIALNRFVRGSGDTVEEPQLTHREQQVLVHIAEGHGNKEIAHTLGVGVRTVETHRERIMRKLDIHTIAGLTKYAIQRNLVPLHKE